MFELIDGFRPEKATSGSRGYDLRAAEDCVVPSKGWRVIRLGFKFPVDADIRPRSGLAAKYGVTVLNTPGTIDGDYRDEWKVILVNHGEGSFRVTRGDRVAQVLFCVDPMWPCTQKNREGGLGSTGLEV